MYNYGDITNIKGSEVPIVDIVTGGSPCQDLSVAGKRAGLAGERSGLFMEQIRLIKEMRDEYRRTNDDGRNVSPRYMVWENVAGAFSSNKGEDFRAVLEEIAKIADEDAVIPEPPKGKWAYAGLIVGDGSNGPYSICWRLHDSQFHGVPQRRRRLCVLADFNGLTAGKILFELRREAYDSHTKQTVMDTRKESGSEVQSESSCVSGNSESCGEKREGTSEDAEGCSHTSGGAISFQERAGKPGGGKGILIQDERTGALSTLNNQPVCYGVVTKGNGDAFINPNTHTSLSIGGGQAGQGYPCVLENKCLNPWDVQSKHIQPEDGIAESLYSGECRYGGGESYVLQSQPTIAMETFHCTTEEEKVQTLKARDYKDPQVICLNDQGSQQMNVSKDVTATLRAEEHDHQPVVSILNPSDSQGNQVADSDGIYPALRGCGGAGYQQGYLLDHQDKVIVFEPGAASRVGGHVYEDGITGTVRANAGDNQQAIVCFDAYNQAVTGEISKPLTNAATDADHIPIVYGICSDGSNSMRSSNPHSGIYEAETSRTLDLNGGNPACNQGGMAVVQGVDCYNLTTTGDVGRTMATAGGGLNEHIPCVVQVETEVSVRKYPVDTKRLIECIQAHRNMSVSKVAKQLNKPKTLVEHWFRKDKCFAIPDADTWMQFKNLLGIETDEFDESIMTFEVKPGKYDMANRIHMGDISPTLMAGSENTLYCLEGNGSRESHKGDGYKESDVMYTLNTVEQHAVCYRKKGHPQNAEQGQGWEETEVNDTLNIFDNGESRTPTLIMQNVLCIENHPNDSRVKISKDGIVQTLSSRMGTGGGNVPMVMETYQETTGSLCASGYNKLGTQEAMNDMYVVQSCNWDGSQISPTLTANNANGAQRMPDKDNFNAVITYGVDSYNQSAECEVQQTLRTNGGGDNSPKVCTYKKKNNAGEYDDGVGTLKACGGDYGGGSETLVTTYQNTTGTICEAISKGTSNQIAEQDQLITNSIVRRLTPKECERLQGFPDDWTNIGEWVDESGKKHKNADSHRYKALGNSIALPFWQWLSDRMVAQLKKDGVENPTMASLFDGIGGFPLVFSRSGCKPMWISEIEDFPIAVTRVRFPDEEEN